MRHMLDMDTIQIEVTNHCINRCSNCTRLVSHHKHPYYMDRSTWEQAIDSMVGYPKMTGIMGGEPLLHPYFLDICDYLRSRIPREQCGLWTCFPVGFEHYRDVITATFGNIFLNDHTRADILHTPILVHPKDVSGLLDWQRDYYQHHCWVQNSWSAAINPLGAYFCEIAAAMAITLGYSGSGWEVANGWWLRAPRDYVSQIKLFCDMCGACLPMYKRESTSGLDDISPTWVAKLTRRESPKIRMGKYVEAVQPVLMDDDRKPATYKDIMYRDVIAAKYGIVLSVNRLGFQTPQLMMNWTKENDNGKGKEVEWKEVGIPPEEHSVWESQYGEDSVDGGREEKVDK